MLFIQLAEHCKQSTTETTICNCSPKHLYINRGIGTYPRRCGTRCRGKAAATRRSRRPRGEDAALRAQPARGKAASCRGKAARGKAAYNLVIN